MKKTNHFLYWVLPLILLFAPTLDSHGQILKKLGKKMEKAAERTVERRMEKETEEKTDAMLDSILEPGKNTPKPDVPSGGDINNPTDTPPVAGSEEPKTIQVYSKFDFVPGDKLLFFDQFLTDFIGDFPSKWNTNGSGEVVTVNDSPEKWMEFIPGYGIYYIPDIPKLPEAYTIEFDLLAVGMDSKTSSIAGILISLSDDSKFKDGDHYANAWLPLGQYDAFNIRMRNYIQGVGSEINSAVRADIRQAILDQPHISIAVNKQRYRLWVNEKKYVDIPRMVPANTVLSSLKFNVNGIKDGKERLFISNLKIAEGGLDLRRKLIAEGKVSTNGILFNSGSANIQPQSMGIILQISQVLQQERNMNLKIVGHTDADGEDATNMELSKKRAEAVKDALVDVYNIAADRLTSEGKGETLPIGDNSTVDGKAQNRRVEFIKQ